MALRFVRNRVQNLSDLLIAVSLTLTVGTAASFIVPGGRSGGALLGSTTGAVLGAAISSKRQRQSLDWKCYKNR